MTPLAAIVSRLKNDEGIATLVSQRVADHDVRRDRTPGYFDADGDMLPCLCVDDFGEVSFAGGIRQGQQDYFYVWLFATNVPDGRAVVGQLADLVIGALDGFLAEGRRLVQYTKERAGAQDAQVTDGAMDRLTFRCVGVHAGMAA